MNTTLLVQAPTNLLTHLFKKDQVKIVSYPTSYEGDLPEHLDEGNCRFELVSVKLSEGTSGPKWRSADEKQLQVCYLRAQGKLQQALEQLCNFAALSPGKVSLN
ncbi:MAG: hypothetical protein HC767_03760 [Akkermansiaceae bacterium]|nr:hypothetical protein [Akkermansiaceae bacterium]